MCLKSILLVFAILSFREEVSSFTVGSKPYGYAECHDNDLDCEIYGRIDLNNYMQQIIGHYRKNDRTETFTRMVITQHPLAVPQDLTKFTTDFSETPFLRLPNNVLKYGRTASLIEISMNTSLYHKSITGLRTW